MGITQQTNRYVFNPADYGYVDPTGVNDSTLAITNANNLAIAAGGGKVQFGQGTFLTGNIPLSPKVFWDGAGYDTTRLKLKNGANTDLLSGQTNLINLAAAQNSGSNGTLYNFGISNMTLDGNKAGQSSGTSYPLRFYGYGYTFENIRVVNGYTGGILSDWNGGSDSPGHDSMESRWVNVIAHDNNGMGIEMGGPHDSQWVDVNSYLNGGHGVHFAPNNTGTQLVNCHAWGTAQGVSAISWFIESGGNHFSNIAAEGSDTYNVVFLASNNMWFGGHIFSGGANSTVNGMQIGQQAGLTPYPGQILQSGGVTTAIAPSGLDINTRWTNCGGPNGSIWFANDGGNNIIKGEIFQTTNTPIRNAAGIAASDNIDLFVSGIAADGTTAMGGTRLIAVNSTSAFRITDQSTDILDLDTHNKILTLPNATALKLYSDNYTTRTVKLDSGTIFVFQSATSPALASAGTITTTGVGEARVAPAANVNGVILQTGTSNGQVLKVVNESAFFIIFAASGTSNVADGTNSYVAPNDATDFIWDSVTGFWYRCGISLPVPWALYEGDLASGAGAALTAGAIYLVGVKLETPYTATQMRCQFTAASPTGNVDMGIYDTGYNLLGHTGAIAAVTGLFTQNLTANLILPPGLYWLAWLDTVADAVWRAQAPSALSGLLVAQRTSLTNYTVLPASLASATADNANRVAIMALRSGGFA